MSGVFTYLRTCFSEAHLQNERTSTNVKSYQKACNMRLPVYVYFISFTRWDKQCKKRKLKTCQTRSFTGMLISSTYSQNETNFASVKPCKAMPEAITSTHFLLFPSRSPRLNFIRLDSNVDQGKTMFKCSNTLHTNTPPRRKYFPTDIMTQKAWHASSLFVRNRSRHFESFVIPSLVRG